MRTSCPCCCPDREAFEVQQRRKKHKSNGGESEIVVTFAKSTGVAEHLNQSRALILHLLSYHKFNESQTEEAVLKRLQQGEIVAQICDAGTPGISDPSMELVKLCVDENIPVIPIPGPSAFVAALSASGLATEEFTFVGFLPKHARSRKERLIVSAKEVATQIFYVPPHKQCAIAREMTKIHEEFWCGTLEEAKGAFLTHQPKGEITFWIEGKANCVVEAPSESQLENELRELISGGQCLSSAVKLVAGGYSMRRKEIYSLALRKFGKQWLTELTNNETLSLQHQVQAVAPLVLQQYSSDTIQKMLSDVSLAISSLTNRKTKDQIMILNSKRFLDRLVSTLEEKKHHQVKLKEGLKDLSAKRMELQNSLTSLWPKQFTITMEVHVIGAYFQLHLLRQHVKDALIVVSWESISH
ncbi:Ribosomal RNA small subunit methyltransferase I [Camellia lanceoleosa]|uniref:Ribosomal RNA small subunit methyltransferase I n=1 Tax=Camellia lanceoleosa TaxID=1840588 RepID=A0ACC0GCH8_9ERIC|nr:Ribosomal RNA small subunit methyltransferase I [Camellia lanceoleosa]